MGLVTITTSASISLTKRSGTCLVVEGPPRTSMFCLEFIWTGMPEGGLGGGGYLGATDIMTGLADPIIVDRGPGHREGMGRGLGPGRGVVRVIGAGKLGHRHGGATEFNMAFTTSHLGRPARAA